MNKMRYLISRHTKLFFKDKGTFLPSLIAPLILLLLFVTFLGRVYRDSFRSVIPNGIKVPDELINGFVGGWLLSSLLAVCCVTVAFGANMIMVQDKMLGTKADLTIAPVKSYILSFSYYISTAAVTAIICYVSLGVGFIYLHSVGWFLTAADVLFIMLDVAIMVMFGTALSSVILYFVKNQGGATAVVTIVSSTYGFICGAYMPISSFSNSIQSIIKSLPGTYGTILLHKQLMGAPLDKLEEKYLPGQAVKTIRDAFDCNLYIGGDKVSVNSMYLVICAAVIALIVLYLMINILRRDKHE